MNFAPLWNKEAGQKVVEVLHAVVELQATIRLQICISFFVCGKEHVK